MEPLTPADILAECIGCGHPKHATYGCQSSALFIKGRCGCDSHFGDLPKKWAVLEAHYLAEKASAEDERDAEIAQHETDQAREDFYAGRDVA